MHRWLEIRAPAAVLAHQDRPRDLLAPQRRREVEAVASVGLRRRCDSLTAAIFLDKNRRHIGKSQSKSVRSLMPTVRLHVAYVGGK
jgi:hypothetical protein